jgi:hypothetical protein
VVNTRQIAEDHTFGQSFYTILETTHHVTCPISDYVTLLFSFHRINETIHDVTHNPSFIVTTEIGVSLGESQRASKCRGTHYTYTEVISVLYVFQLRW